MRAAPTDVAMLESLTATDRTRPTPPVVDALAAAQNRHLLRYVAHDPFGAHVFPGDIPDLPTGTFLEDLNTELADCPPIHLWSYIPTCAYRCHFCQYPVVVVKGPPEVTSARLERWVDLTIAEAQLWLRRVPNLRTAPIGEFNVFGGTPSLLAPQAVTRLLEFFRTNFAFTAHTPIRFEGDPATLTGPMLEFLAAAGCTKVSCGVQSFDDEVLRLSGREHTAEDCLRFLADTRRVGFDRVTIDLMYGLLDQSVASVERDLSTVLAEGPTGVVCTKLHLRSFADTRTGVAGDKPAAWAREEHRDRLAERGHHWPTLGEQYQMRAALAGGLTDAGYTEHPTMYFTSQGHPPELWKSIMVDQDRQQPEVAIGLGGSSSCGRSEALTEVNPGRYATLVEAGELPLASATRFGDRAMENRAITMALSTCSPVRDDLHRARFGGRSLFDPPWGDRFTDLSRRGLTTVDRAAGTVSLTPVGVVLVEAIMNTELMSTELRSS